MGLDGQLLAQFDSETYILAKFWPEFIFWLIMALGRTFWLSICGMHILATYETGRTFWLSMSFLPSMGRDTPFNYDWFKSLILC